MLLHREGNHKSGLFLSPAMQIWLPIGITNKCRLIDGCYLCSKSVIPAIHSFYLYYSLLWSISPNPLDENPLHFLEMFFLRRKVYEAKDFMAETEVRKYNAEKMFATKGVLLMSWVMKQKLRKD